MAPAEKTEINENVTVAHHTAAHSVGTTGGSIRGFSSPLLGDNTDRPARTVSGRTSFASAGGWVVNL
ncbi:MAG: hypothetical protein WCF85_15685 [Rhodospirillaceae bacterium]